MSRPWPKLSETLTGPRDPDHCQHCAGTDWVFPVIECDDQDQPTAVTLMLCSACFDAVVPKHPRLYIAVHRNMPRPGCMRMCTACRHREQLACRHPDLIANGGTGLMITHAQPIVAMVDGTKGGKRHGWKEVWYQTPPSKCAGREEAPV